MKLGVYIPTTPPIEKGGNMMKIASSPIILVILALIMALLEGRVFVWTL